MYVFFIDIPVSLVFVMLLIMQVIMIVILIRRKK